MPNPNILSRDNKNIYELAGLLTQSFLDWPSHQKDSGTCSIQKITKDFTASGKVEGFHPIPLYTIFFSALNTRQKYEFSFQKIA